MAIRRRTASVNLNQHILRHPLLKQGTVAAAIYRFIKQRPGSTHKEFSILSTSSQPVTNLLNAGLLRREGASKATYRYFAVAENETGPGRDILEVDIKLYINQYGEYSIDAKLQGQTRTAHQDVPVFVLAKTVKLSVPSPREVLKKRDITDIEPVDTSGVVEEVDIHADYFTTGVEKDEWDSAPLIIDGDYNILP